VPERARLRDGSSVVIRPAGRQDEQALRQFLLALKPRSRRMRFFTAAANIERAAHWAADTDVEVAGEDVAGAGKEVAGGDVAGAGKEVAGKELSDERYGLLALDGEGTIVGHAAYARLEDPTRAEVAVEVADRLHGQGLGTILVESLAAVAELRGVKRFVAEVLPENHAMLDVFRDGFDAHIVLHEGTDAVDFETGAWRLAQRRFGGSSPKPEGSSPQPPSVRTT
jgi:acetate---CoA ligase (ADP-forming)